MAKELPFFKFFVSEWNDGRIVDCSMEAQGLFTNLCSLYWSRLGALDERTAMRKLCERYANAYKELKKAGIIKLSDGAIFIEFLDEQLGERKKESDRYREIALKRWKKDANAMPTHSDSNAQAMQIREDKDKREIRAYGPTHDNYFLVKSNPAIRVNGKAGLIEYMEANRSVLNNPGLADKFMLSRRGKAFNEFSHVWNDYNAWIERQFK